MAMLMPRRLAPNLRTALAIALAASAAGCSGSSSSGSSNPTGPSGGGTTPTCRTYPTATTVTTTALGVTMNALLTAAFNTSTNQATITVSFVGGALCSTAVHSYRSTADFVDEVRVIPPTPLELSTTTTNSGSCGTGTGTATSTYDAQRRVVQVTTPGGTTTYTAWDSSGRPTAGTLSTGGTISNVYNDAARTLTQTQTTSAGTSVGTQTYDANGAQLSIVVTGQAGSSTTTFNNTSTATVCK
jgi:YD repeat-containing protein